MNSLSGFDLFRAEVFSRRRMNWSEIDRLVSLAREGDLKARESITLLCLPYVVWLAWRYKPYLPHDDYGDVVGIGNLALVTCMDGAMNAEHPVRYLMKCAHYRVLEYVACRASLISQPKTSKATHVVSLEATPVLKNTLPYGSKRAVRAIGADHDWLAEALNALTPLQREVVLIKYGFPERSCDSLYKLSLAQGVSGRYTATLKAALRKLRKHALVYHFAREEERLA